MADQWFEIPWRDNSNNKYQIKFSILVENPDGQDLDQIVVELHHERLHKITVFIHFTGNFNVDYPNDKGLIDVLGNEGHSPFLRDLFLDYIFGKNRDELAALDNSVISFDTRSIYSKRVKMDENSGLMKFIRDPQIIAAESRFARELVLREFYSYHYTMGASSSSMIHHLCHFPNFVIKRAIEVLTSRGFLIRTQGGYFQLTHEATTHIEASLLTTFSNQIFLIAACQPDIEKMIDLVYKPAVEELGYTLFFQEASEPKDKIHDEMWESLERCKLVLCDFTHERPNCFIEYGFAYGKKKHILLTVSDVGWEDVNGRVKMPFDTLTQKFSIWQEKWLNDPDKFQSEIESFKNDLKGRISRKLQIIDSQSEI